MDSLNVICRPIERELQDYRSLLAETVKCDTPLLTTALRHLFQRRGKQMRPILVLLVAKYVGQVNANVLHAAVALELLHTASLVHDDVVDESDRRRGQESINALLNNKVAILVGDFLFSRALHHANCCSSPLVMEWLSELGQTLADGELQQLANINSKEIEEQTYYEIIEKKTASMFASCTKMGTHLAGGNGDEVLKMEAFGKCVGICFQLRDDIFDYDAVNSTGKPTGNDMKEGKLTLPIVHAILDSGDEAHRALALKVRQGEATDDDIARLVSFAKVHGGIEYAVKAIHYYSQCALALLGDDADSDVGEALRLYVDFVAHRSF